MKKEGWEMVETKAYLKVMGIRGNACIISGNEACALGALVAGCQFFAGYPITPSSVILHAMTEYLPPLGGRWYAPEDELATIGMCIAASLCGDKAMTATSGPGFSLMQEELGAAILNEVPLVVVNAMRVGPSTGQPTKPSSADINCMIHGRHGDAGDAVVILSPRSVQECFSMTVVAFNISEEWRTPVFLALDGYLSQLEERACIPEQVYVYDRIKDKGEPPFGKDGDVSNFVSVGGIRPQAYTGVMHDSDGNRSSYRAEVAEEYIAHLLAKHRSIIPVLQKDTHYSLFGKEAIAPDTELLLVSYGCASRASKDAVERLRDRGIKTAYLNLPVLWPLHSDVFEMYKNIPHVVVAENNTGQLLPFITPYFPKAKISSFAKWNGTPIQTGELVRFCENLFKKGFSKAADVPERIDVSVKKYTQESNRTDIPWHEYSEQPLIFPSEDEQEMEEEKEILVHKPYPFCPGCGHQSFIDQLLPVLSECGLANKNTIFVSGIGCGSIVPATFEAHLVKTSHGRALNAARAARLEYPERNIIVISGDGDLVNIGCSHLIHTAHGKNRFPMVCFCLDNANYGMTGGQPSATTPCGASTSISSPESLEPFDLKKLLYDGCGIDFFARVSVADHEYLSEVIRKAIAASRKTFAFVQVFSHCTAHFVKNNRDLFSRDNLKEQQGIWERE